MKAAFTFLAFGLTASASVLKPRQVVSQISDGQAQAPPASTPGPAAYSPAPPVYSQPANTCPPAQTYTQVRHSPTTDLKLV